MYDDALEALHTTTVTSTTTSTSTTHTVTRTTTTVTSSTSTTTKASAFLSLYSSDGKEGTGSLGGVIALLCVLVGAGGLIGFIIRRGLLKRCMERKYGHFDDSNAAEARRIPPQSFGEGAPP